MSDNHQLDLIETPDVVYAELFDAVQRSGIFSDSKQFVDASPKMAPQTILQAYRQNRNNSDFDLKRFVLMHFTLSEPITVDYGEDSARPVREHIEHLWDVLSQSEDDSCEAPSLIPLPKPYMVPGGRFREIYYWDSYFTMLGQAESGRIDMLTYMVDNFAYLIDHLGFIPNGNRSYFCTRSQPPFFALMVTLLAEKLGDATICVRYLPQLEKEYQFWMQGADQLQRDGDCHRRVIKHAQGFLNRYWDDAACPRQESYREDVETASQTNRSAPELYRDIRAACESGWDFTSRWLAHSNDFTSIRTTNVVPVDLNALMFYLEDLLATAYCHKKDASKEQFYRQRSTQRANAIQQLFFDKNTGFFCDLLLPDFKPNTVLSLAAAFPLFFKLATDDQAKQVEKKLNTDFLKTGGWVTTLNFTGQQWDAPNGWAPLQWIVYKGLCNYGFNAGAEQGARRWVDNNLQRYRATGQLVEKYNVEHTERLAQGGEYLVQHGFGWTNAVLLMLMNELKIE